MVLKKREIVRTGKLMQLRSKTYPDLNVMPMRMTGVRKTLKQHEFGLLAKFDFRTLMIPEGESVEQLSQLFC
jgi:hypothetical protein